MHLASHILAKVAKILPGDWEKKYKHPVYYIVHKIAQNGHPISFFTDTQYRFSGHLLLK